MPITTPSELTDRALGVIMQGARPPQIAAWIGPLREHMAANAIDTLERMAGFLASTANETGCLQATVEMGWFHTPWERAQAMFGHACPPRAEYEGRKATMGEGAWNEWFFNHVYDDRIRGPRYAIGGNVNDGDGWKYRGRGVGITGRNNYRDAGRKAGLPLEENPDLLAIPAYAAQTFARMWADIGNNERMDRGDFDGAILILNAGLSDITPHRRHYARTLRALRDVDVRAMQLALIAAGFPLARYGADGDFGGETRGALGAFQHARGLPVTGEPDPATLAALAMQGRQGQAA